MGALRPGSRSCLPEQAIQMLCRSSVALRATVSHVPLVDEHSYNGHQGTQSCATRTSSMR